MPLSILALLLGHATLAVGEGLAYSKIEDAVAAASPGDVIEVHSAPGDYRGAAVRVKKPNLRFVGVGDRPVKIDGGKFEYSGVADVPRAIFQFEPTATGGSVTHFELCGAHNGSHNGAGVRINGASGVRIEACDIHGNDMGIMSNGAKGNPAAGAGQTIERCHIHENGSFLEPGQNHNLYLGGTSALIRFCEIDHSLTGHNLKSRAHFLAVEYTWIHDSANRECDFVEAWDTERPNSNVLLLGDVIQKDPSCRGNRTTIHFGQERGTRNGTLFVVNTTIETIFHSPVVQVTSPDARVEFWNSRVRNIADRNPDLVLGPDGKRYAAVRGSANDVSQSYGDTGLAIGKPVKATYLNGEGRRDFARPLYRYVGDGKWRSTSGAFIGA